MWRAIERPRSTPGTRTPIASTPTRSSETTHTTPTHSTVPCPRSEATHTQGPGGPTYSPLDEPSATGTPQLAGVVFATAALLAAGSPATSGAARHAKPKKPKTPAASTAPFCSSPVVDNYWAPVEKLQPIPAPPEGGVLPFAPVGMTLGATGPQRLLVGGSNIGFRLTNGAPATEAAPRRLDWTVLERLIRLTDERPQPPPGRPQTDRPEAAAGGQAPRADLPDPEQAGDLLARSDDPEPPRPAPRPLRRVHPRRQPPRQRRHHALGHRQRRPRRQLESCFENHGSATVTPTGTNLERLEGDVWRPVALGPPTDTPARLRAPGPRPR